MKCFSHLLPSRLYYTFRPESVEAQLATLKTVSKWPWVQHSILGFESTSYWPSAWEVLTVVSPELAGLDAGDTRRVYSGLK